MNRFATRFRTHPLRLVQAFSLLSILVAVLLLPGFVPPARAAAGDPVAIAYEWEVRATGELAGGTSGTRVEHTRNVAIHGSATVRRAANGAIVAAPFELTLTDESVGSRSTASSCFGTGSFTIVERQRYRIVDPQRYGAPDPYFAQGDALAEYEGENGRTYILNPFGRSRAWFSIKDQAGTRPFTYDEETMITDCNGTRTTTARRDDGRYAILYTGAGVPFDLPQLESDASGDHFSHTSDYTVAVNNDLGAERTPMRVSIRVTARVLERESGGTAPSPPPSPSAPGGLPCVGTRELAVTTRGAGGVNPGSGAQPACKEIELTATADADNLFLGWIVDGQPAGHANPLTVKMDRDRAVVALFTARPVFNDVNARTPYAEAIAQLAARGTIRGYGDGRFGPGDGTLRAQMAALIVRALGWDGQDWGNPFSDRGSIDADLWRNVGTLAHYGVARGYPDGTYDPTALVTNAQSVSFVTRAMVARGYWQAQSDNPALYPNIPGDIDHRIDIATYVHYVGSLPGVEGSGAWDGWDQPAARGWFAELLWRAIDAQFGVDRTP